MFTGIVEELGKVQGIQKGAKSARLTLGGKVVLKGTKLGDSIAVNGVCLTVTEFSEDKFSVDVMAETLDKSNLGNLKTGDVVNLERAMAVGDRLGGHIVSGHIDGVGKIKGEEMVEIAKLVEIEAPPQVLRYCIQKGSITIDGISLTIVDVSNHAFWVSLIPHTAKLTTLGFKKAGDSVNLEADILGKYVEKMLGLKEESKPQKSKISADYLAQHGFI
jgi:riboflavin synthase